MSGVRRSGPYAPPVPRRPPARPAGPPAATNPPVLVAGSAPLLVDAIVQLLLRLGFDAEPAPAATTRRGAPQAITAVLVRAVTLSHDAAALRAALDRRQARVLAIVLDDVAACAPVVVRTGCPVVVPATATSDELADAVRAAAGGTSAVHAEILASALGDLRATTTRSIAGAGLSARELDVLQLMAAGHTTPQMAGKLGVAESTVKSHVLGAFAKLGTRDRAHAVATALRRGLID